MKKLTSVLLTALLAGKLFSQTIDLPAPQKTGGMPLMEALSKRATIREFGTKELSRQQLSNLLWAAFGINRPDGKRTAPSTRDFQGTDLYVLLKQGVYLYDAKNNKLNRVSTEDLRAEGTTQTSVADAPVAILLVADLSKLGNGNKQEKMYTAGIDAGYISQNIYLYCASESLVTGARGSIDRSLLSSKLNLRSDQSIIIAHSVGYPKK
jgi:hypothetical protein